MKTRHPLTRTRFLRCCLPVAAAIVVASCGDNLTVPVDREDYQPALLEPLSCVPNLDGQIDSWELQAAMGVPVSYLINPVGEGRAVDLVGDIDDAGRRLWDWGADFASDQVIEVRAASLADQWYASAFPDGQFVTPFDAGETVDAIYYQDDAGFYLLGLASTEQDPVEGRTLLVYTTPILLYRFPIMVGDSWVSTGDIRDGVYRGLPYAGHDTYEVAVDGSGRLVLPDLTFTQAIRVSTRTVLSPAVGQATSQRTVSFLFECFGEVARATSQADETQAFFSTALEVRRIGF